MTTSSSSNNSNSRKKTPEVRGQLQVFLGAPQGLLQKHQFSHPLVELEVIYPLLPPTTQHTPSFLFLLALIPTFFLTAQVSGRRRTCLLSPPPTRTHLQPSTRKPPAATFGLRVPSAAATRRLRPPRASSCPCMCRERGEEEGEYTE